LDAVRNPRGVQFSKSQKSGLRPTLSGMKMINENGIGWLTGQLGQETGTTNVDVDTTTGMVTATCETDLDLNAWGYYMASVGCVVTDGGGNTIVSGGNTDIDGELGYAQIVVSFQGIPGTAYLATGSHNAGPIVGTIIYDRGMPQQRYWDEYNFEYFVQNSQPDLWSPYSWFGPGPAIPVRPTVIHIGKTRDARVYPIDMVLLVTHAWNDFPPGCDVAFTSVIGSSMSYTKDQFFSSLIGTTFYQYPQGAPNMPAHGGSEDARTQPPNAILLFPNFYGFPGAYTTETFKEFVVTHEGIHHYTGWSDSTVFANFYNAGLRNPTLQTNDITLWLTAGCPNPWLY
jgi:hypothetical protein